MTFRYFYYIPREPYNENTGYNDTVLPANAVELPTIRKSGNRVYFYLPEEATNIYAL